MKAIGKLLKPFFRVSRAEATSFKAGDYKAALRLETVISTVTKGCQITLQNSRSEALVPRLNAFEAELRGFAYEGAGIGLAALDCLLPWKNRTKDFLAGAGEAYIYAVPIGAGLALARMRRNPEPFLTRLDPVLCWLVLDGYGFHEGFFRRRRYVEQQALPKRLSPYARRIFDQGLGRSIWFLGGGNVDEVASTIMSFAPGRQADLWNGVGLACGYTGGVSRAAIETMQALAGPYRVQLAVGAAMAAHARHRAGTPAPYAELACEALCDASSIEASGVVEDAFQNLPLDGRDPAYAVWQQRLSTRFAALETAANK